LPQFDGTFRTVEAQAILFLIKKGFEPSEKDGHGRCWWEMTTSFDIIVRAYPVFSSYQMEVHIAARKADDLIPCTATKKIQMMGEEIIWKGELEKAIGKAVENALRVMNVKCPHCGARMRERKIRAEGPHKEGTFFGCSNYPQCRGAIFPWNEMENDEGKWAMANCPDCNAPLVIRYAKKGPYSGNRFYGCKAFPKCKRIVSDDELIALKMMQGDEARAPWEWNPPSDESAIDIKLIP
jgi:ssDNA-binding Zn-finger/Zn-ribbon topoisomerase 1